MRKGMKLVAMVVPFALTSVGLAVLAWLMTAGTARAAACAVPTGTYATIQSAADDLNCDTINLTAALYVENVTVTHSLTIQGLGALSTTVDGNAGGSVFTIQLGLAVTLTDLTITNGMAPGGGGIHAISSTLIMDAVSVISNTATGSLPDGGGGVYNDNGDVQISNSAISGNSAVDGGGIYNRAGIVTVRNSTVEGNSATNGGGVYAAIGSATRVTNGTVSGNSATLGNGGGIWNDGTLTVTNGTLSGNSASSGGGIWNQGAVELSNSIIANSVNSDDCSGTGSFSSLGYNLDSDNTCNLTAAGDITGSNPLLGPLQNNGGDTLTHHLLPGSPAIDAGNPATPGSGGNACESIDQRGAIRPWDGDGDGSAQCDMGAVENALIIHKSGPASAAVGAPITYSLEVANQAPITLTDVVVTDAIPIGASYLNGGTLVGNVVSWTVPSLAFNTTITRHFAVVATATVTNSDYRVSSNEGHEVIGNVNVSTLVETPVSGLVATNDSPTLAGNATTLTATITAGSNPAFTWAFGDGTTSSGAVVSHVYPAAGIYTAVVTTSNSINALVATTNVAVTARVYLPTISHEFCIDFADDFNNPTSGWPVIDNANERFEYLNGEYRMLVKNSFWWVATRPGYKATNFTASVDVRNVTGVDGTYGLAFGISDDWREMYTFEIDPIGRFVIWRLDSSGWTFLSTGSSPSINVGTATNRIQVVRNGASIGVYANGQPLSSISDNSFLGARHVGLIATTYVLPNLDTRFNDFSVDETGCASSIGFSSVGEITGGAIVERDLPAGNSASGVNRRNE